MPSATCTPRQIYQLKNLIEYSAQSVTNKLISRKKGGDILLMAFREGQSLKEHTAPVDAIVQLLTGKCEITIAGIPNHLKAGELIILPAEVPHALKATSDFKMLLTKIKDE